MFIKWNRNSLHLPETIQHRVQSPKLIHCPKTSLRNANILNLFNFFSLLNSTINCYRILFFPFDLSYKVGSLWENYFLYLIQLMIREGHITAEVLRVSSHDLDNFPLISGKFNLICRPLWTLHDSHCSSEQVHLELDWHCWCDGLACALSLYPAKKSQKTLILSQEMLNLTKHTNGSILIFLQQKRIYKRNYSFFKTHRVVHFIGYNFNNYNRVSNFSLQNTCI